MEVKLLDASIDILEKFMLGGLIGIIAYIIINALASFPASLISSSMVTPLSVVVGALWFAGSVIPDIRKRILYLEINESKRISYENNLTSTTSAKPGTTLVQIRLASTKILPDLKDIFSNKESSEILAGRDTISKNVNDLIEDKVSK